jgi:hypothetical protein
MFFNIIISYNIFIKILNKKFYLKIYGVIAVPS